MYDFVTWGGHDPQNLWFLPAFSRPHVKVLKLPSMH